MTAEEFLKQNNEDLLNEFPKIQQLMIQFAKYHVEAALKEAAEKAVTDYEYAGETGEFDDIPVYDYFVDKESILNAYPLENIK